ncbi:hypothetical protein EJ06DRAFT_524393 [Trichodelitschia bisporula]|uniref:Uncharacterized protein n=1 Tax=Trichodelitschia bisporula TaxID=703511 RepID=A0A6G1HLM8_9PEZI|nr:hypothetical protein EJ06DRAFT_524393 [Trichodelitschia bisporula]
MDPAQALRRGWMGIAGQSADIEGTKASKRASGYAEGIEVFSAHLFVFVIIALGTEESSPGQKRKRNMFEQVVGWVIWKGIKVFRCVDEFVSRMVVVEVDRQKAIWKAGWRREKTMKEAEPMEEAIKEAERREVEKLNDKDEHPWPQKHRNG